MKYVQAIIEQYSGKKKTFFWGLFLSLVSGWALFYFVFVLK